ncbi:MAG: hypothetical protein HKL99_14175 [Burkholderiales bacterium]|nr:hypothetical protein [Burkholderiales bacterium]
MDINEGMDAGAADEVGLGDGLGEFEPGSDELAGGGVDAGLAPAAPANQPSGGKALKVVAVLAIALMVSAAAVLAWRWYSARRAQALQQQMQQLAARRAQESASASHGFAPLMAPPGNPSASAAVPAGGGLIAGSASQPRAQAAAAAAMPGASQAPQAGAVPGMPLHPNVASMPQAPESMPRVSAAVPQQAAPAGAGAPVAVPAGDAVLMARVDRLQRSVDLLARAVREVQKQDRVAHEERVRIEHREASAPSHVQVHLAAVTGDVAVLDVDGRWLSVRAGSDVPGIGKVLVVGADGVKIQGYGWLKP